MNRSYRYRLYPTRKQQIALDEMLAAYRELWNAALEERKEAWQRQHVSINCYAQCSQLKDIRKMRPDFARFNHTAAQQMLRRLDKAFQAFFRRLKAGETPGYPRFRSRSRFHSVEYRFGDGASLRDERLAVQGVGHIKVKWHRAIPADATVKAVVVTRDGDGHWYAVFQLEMPDVQPTVHDGPAVGIDLGVMTLVALSTGELISAPRYFRQAEKTLRKQQRRLSRRKKYSSRWQKARQQVAKTQGHIANQRWDMAHKLSRRLVNEFSVIAVEDLNINGLAKSRLAKSVHDAGWSQLVSFLTYKAESAGTQIVTVDARYTSQACSGCGCLVPKSLGVRVHICPECGLVLDRDENAARNILHRAQLGRSCQALTQRVAASVA